MANTINGYRNEALQYKNDAENYKLGSLQASLVSEGYSSGTQNGVPVGESSPYFENNAKYYADESAKGKGDLANRIDSLAGNVAEEWTAKTYLPGEYVLYNDKLWKCLNATASTPAENYYWESVKITDELGSANIYQYQLGEHPTNRRWIDGKIIYSNIIQYTTQTNLTTGQWVKTIISKPDSIDSFVNAFVITNNQTLQYFNGFGFIDDMLAINSNRAVSLLNGFLVVLEYTKN